MNPKLIYLELDNIPQDNYDNALGFIDSLLEFFDPELYIKDKMLLQLIVNNIEPVMKYVDNNFPEAKSRLNAKMIIISNLIFEPVSWNYFCDKIMFTNLKRRHPNQISIFESTTDAKELWDTIKSVPGLATDICEECVKLGIVKSITYFNNRIPIVVFDKELVKSGSLGTSGKFGIEVFARKDDNFNLIKDINFQHTVRHELTHQILEFKCTLTKRISDSYAKIDRAKFLELEKIRYMQSMFSELNAYFFEYPESTLIFEHRGYKHQLSKFGLKDKKSEFNNLTDKEYFDMIQIFIPKVEVLNQFIANSMNNTIENETQNSAVIRRITILFKLMFVIKNFDMLPDTVEEYNQYI